MRRRHEALRLATASALVLAVILAVLAMPGGALAGVLVEASRLPDPGKWRVRAQTYYTPYFLTLLAASPSTVPPSYLVGLKDCTAPPQPGSENDCPPRKNDRPVESRHFVQVKTVAEVGLAPGMALRMSLPVEYVQQFSQTQLPPHMPSPVAFGLGDFSIGLERALYELPGGTAYTTLRANVPSTNPALGNEIVSPCFKDAAGKTQDCTVFANAVSTDLGLTATQMVFSDVVLVHGSFFVNYPFRRSGVEPATTWRGMRYDFGTGLEYRPLPALGLTLESLGRWANPSEQIESGSLTHNLVTTTGFVQIDVVPGVSWRVTDALTLQAAVSRPVYQSGYQRDFPFLAGVLGVVLDL